MGRPPHGGLLGFYITGTLRRWLFTAACAHQGLHVSSRSLRVATGVAAYRCAWTPQWALGEKHCPRRRRPVRRQRPPPPPPERTGATTPWLWQLRPTRGGVYYVAHWGSDATPQGCTTATSSHSPRAPTAARRSTRRERGGGPSPTSRARGRAWPGTCLGRGSPRPARCRHSPSAPTLRPVHEQREPPAHVPPELRPVCARRRALVFCASTTANWTHGPSFFSACGCST
jgi:hypothetical protein